MGHKKVSQVVRLKDFEGPLDLLLHLIGKAKIDIQEIFVSEITQQYIATVQSAEDINMDEADYTNNPRKTYSKQSI